MMPRSTDRARRRIVGGVSVVLAAVAPASASAAWSAAAPLPVGSEHRVVVGAEAGRVAVLGDIEGGPALAVHQPGAAAWAPGQAVPAGDASGVVGDGGVVARTTPGTVGQDVEVLRAQADGTFASAGTQTIGPDDGVLAVVGAPDGSLALAVQTGTERLRLLRRSPAGVWTTTSPAGTAVISDAALAIGPSGILTVAWVVSADDLATAVRAATFGPGLPGTAITLDELDDPDPADDVAVERSVDDLVASPSRTGEPGAVWVDGDDVSGVNRIRGGNVGAVGSYAEGRVSFTGAAVDVDSSATRTLVRWADDAGTAAATVATIDRSCSTPSGLGGLTFALRGGELVAAGLRDGRLAVGEIDGACTVGADPSPTPGPELPADVILEAAADAEGTLVVAGRDASGAVSVAVDDRTLPRIAQLQVPPTVAAGATFTASAVASDAWGPVGLRWSIGGVDAGAAATASGRFPRAGSGVVDVVARDAVGNEARDRRTVTVDDEPSAPAPRPAPTPPPGPDPGPPVAPPVGVPVPDPEPRPAARRPQARITSVQQRPTGWFMGVRVRYADRLEVALYRERYKRGAELGGRPTRCAPRARPVRRPEAGRRARLVVQSGGDRLSVPLSKRMTLALRQRGRYTLTVVARSGRDARSAPAVRRFTVCR